MIKIINDRTENLIEFFLSSFTFAIIPPDINKKIEQFVEFIFMSLKRFFANTMIKNKVFDREVGQDTLIIVQLFVILLVFFFVWKIYL